jgi:hypothetical protein
MLFSLSCCSRRGQFIVTACNFVFSRAFSMAQFNSTNEIHRSVAVSDPCSLAMFVWFVLRPLRPTGYVVWSYLFVVFESAYFELQIRKHRSRTCRRQINWPSRRVLRNIV